MIDKGKIAAFHLEFMMVPTIIATGVLSLPSIATKYAGHDMWMTPIIGSCLGFLTVYIAWKLHQLYPNQTPIQYSEKIIGKVLGKLVSFIFVVFYIYHTGIVIRQYSEFITFNVMRETPSIVISISMMLVSALAVRGGIEVIARAAVICTTLYMSTATFLLLLIKDMDISFMLPILENGFMPVMQGSVVYQAWFSEFFILAFLYPFVRNQGKTLKSGMRALLYVLVILSYVNFFVLTILRLTSQNQLYPVYSIVRAITVLGYFENFEVIITASWVLGNFVKMSVFLYVSSISLAQLCRLSNYRRLVFPLCLLIIFFSYWNIPNIVILMNYIVQTQPYYFLFVHTLLPLLLLFVALARKKWSDND